MADIKKIIVAISRAAENVLTRINNILFILLYGGSQAGYLVVVGEIFHQASKKAFGLATGGRTAWPSSASTNTALHGGEVYGIASCDSKWLLL